jgi:hypothetical protein
MTTTFTVNGANATLKMEYTAPTATISAVMDDACHALFDRGAGNHGEDGLRLYSTLTLAEKTKIVDDYTVQTYLNLAKQYKSDADAQAARDAAELAAKARYNLGG